MQKYTELQILYEKNLFGGYVKYEFDQDPMDPISGNYQIDHQIFKCNCVGLIYDV